MATLVEKVTVGRRIEIDGNPELTIDPTPVDDATAAIVGALPPHGCGQANLAGDVLGDIRETQKFLGAAQHTTLRGGLSPTTGTHRDSRRRA